MALTKENAPTPPAMRATYGETFSWTGERCADARPVFRGSNGTVSCACTDH
jgi:hypothetical protein